MTMINQKCLFCGSEYQVARGSYLASQCFQCHSVSMIVEAEKEYNDSHPLAPGTVVPFVVNTSHPAPGKIEIGTVLDHVLRQADTGATNPKDLMGSSKLPMLSVVPMSGLAHAAAAMRYGAYEALRVDGSKGYGPFNWRSVKVLASIYVDAAMRHITKWWDGEDLDKDSLVNALGHAIASLMILLDAIENDCLVDDRPPKGNLPQILDRMKKEKS